MEDVIEVHNTSGGYAKIWEERPGAEPLMHELPPHATQALEPKLANRFLAEYPGTCVEHRIQELPDVPGRRRVWIANLTGNPFLPPYVFIPSATVGQDPVKIPHPIREAVNLKWMIKPSETEIKDIDNLPMYLHYPPTPFELPPYERASVPETIAMMLVQRDACCLPLQQGKVATCREPTSFEPNRSWGLNDMLIWARLADDHFFTPARLKELDIGNEESYGHDKNKIREARSHLWMYVFHILVDKKRGLPPRAAFDAAKKQIAAATGGGPRK